MDSSNTGKPLDGEVPAHQNNVVLNAVPVSRLREELNLHKAEEFSKHYACPFLGILQGSAFDSRVFEFGTVKAKSEMLELKHHDIELVVELKITDRNNRKDRITIGRTPNNDVVILLSKVSKLHATVRRQGQLYKIADAGSRNGTFINGERIPAHQEVPLMDGDIISIGSQVFSFLSLETMIHWLSRI